MYAISVTVHFLNCNQVIDEIIEHAMSAGKALLQI